MLQLDDLVPIAHTSPTGIAAASKERDGGWGALMRLAADFPLEKLSFTDFTSTNRGPSISLPSPRDIPYDQVAALMDNAGDGPTIGLGTGH